TGRLSRPATIPPRPHAPLRLAPRRRNRASSLDHPFMSGEDEREGSNAQQRGDEERNATLGMAEGGEQQSQEPDIRRQNSLGEVERASEAERGPHDQP